MSDTPASAEDLVAPEAPTYRIEVTHEPGFSETWPWVARIIRQSDDWLVKIVSHSTHDGSKNEAFRWINRESAKLNGVTTLYADAQGLPMPAPQTHHTA
jgi:hypothetical protein